MLQHMMAAANTLPEMNNAMSTKYTALTYSKKLFRLYNLGALQCCWSTRSRELYSIKQQRGSHCIARITQWSIHRLE